MFLIHVFNLFCLILIVNIYLGAAIDWYISLQVSSPGPTTLVPSGWYVVPDHPSHRHTLLAGLDVNGLDGWDIHKLGWLKAGKNKNFVTASLNRLVNLFSPSVESCSDGKYSGSFSSGEIDRHDIGGRKLTEEFPFLVDVHVWRRHVEMEHKESPLLALTLQHRSRVGVVVQYSSSHLSDFTGILYQDSFSHLHLNLSLVQASGTINGIIIGAYSTQSIRLRLSQHISNTTHQVKLTATDCLANQVTVTLRSESIENKTITKQIPCISENMRTFHAKSGTFKPIDTGLGLVADCLSCSDSWLHWLDPQQWMDTFWPHTRVVILITMISLGIILTLLLCKVTRLFCQCCTDPQIKIKKKILHDIMLSQI